MDNLLTHDMFYNINHMKRLFSYALAVLIMFNHYFSKVYALENEDLLEKSEIIIADEYAERFCSAKANKFFDGLENEKTLKYSYFRYIGFKNEKISSNNFYKHLIHQIKEKCDIRKEEENEIIDFFLKNMD